MGFARLPQHSNELSRISPSVESLKPESDRSTNSDGASVKPGSYFRKGQIKLRGS